MSWKNFGGIKVTLKAFHNIVEGHLLVKQNLPAGRQVF